MDIQTEPGVPRVAAGPGEPPGEADFTRLYERDYPNIVRYLLRRGAQDTAADLAAETFAIVWQRRDQWRDLPADRQTAWVYGVARKVLANALRSGRRAAGLLERVAQNDPDRQGQAGAGDHSELIVEQLAVGRAFARLSEADRELIRLVAWDGLSPVQIADVLGTRVGTVNTRLHRARQRLKALTESEPAEGRAR